MARLRYAYLLLRRNQTAQARQVLEGAFSIVRFKADGLALNAVYRAQGRNGQNFEEQIQKFTRSLLSAPSAKDIQIEVALDLAGPSAPMEKESSAGQFAEAYQTLRSAPDMSASALSPMSFKRNLFCRAEKKTTGPSKCNLLPKS